MKRNLFRLVVILVFTLPALRVSGAGPVFDETVPPGANYDKADFRLWLPPDTSGIRAIVVLTTGSNGDGRPMAEDAVWQDFASRNKLALIGCRITDKPHEQSFIEEYANASQGSGQALLNALSTYAERTRHPELAAAPLLLWGMSAGGEFNYEFTAWKPERVAAFVVNKGGIYYTALTSRASRNVPGILFTGGKDLQSRIRTITGLFEVLEKHAPLVSALKAGRVKVLKDKSNHLAFFDIQSGFVEVLNNRVTVLVEGASSIEK